LQRARQNVVAVGISCATLIVSVVLTANLLMVASVASASNHYTEKQLQVLGERVGKTYWIQEADGQAPSFLTAPKNQAVSFRARAGDSFEIVELVGRANKNPYYKARFSSGKEGYLRPEVFLQGLNLTFLTIDPLASEKREAAERAQEENERVDWINAQPWPAAAKEAALKGQPVPGMTTNEVRKIAGAPSRVTKVHRVGTIQEEHWYYPDGKQLIFHQGLLTRIAAVK